MTDFEKNLEEFLKTPIKSKTISSAKKDLSSCGLIDKNGKIKSEFINIIYYK